MRPGALAVVLSVFLVGCGVAREAREPSATALTSAISSPRATANETTKGSGLEARVERDACSVYADCLDEAPSLEMGEVGMHASPAAVRSWEKTPEQLRQCSDAMALARAGGLCR
jgi:hypothetical protein